MQLSFQNKSLIQKVSAILIAMGTGFYLIFCQTGNTQNKVNPKAGENGSEECQKLAHKIRMQDMYMSTSKAAPSAFEHGKADKLQSEYKLKCGDQDPLLQSQKTLKK